MATNTYVALDKVTLGSTQTSVTFSNISQTYTDLIVVMSVIPAATVGYGPWFQFNGDTGSNYSITWLQGNGSSATSGRQTSQIKGYLSWSIGLSGPSNAIAHIQNYSNTTTFKTYVDRINETAGSYPGAGATVGLWRSTAAITSIKISNDGGGFASGTNFSLYGIASAEVGAKATGGIISSDTNYWYHTFTSSGTFTPLQSLSCDVLTIAGGGSGRGDVGGGGGAGGLLYSASQSVSSATTVTVGAGAAVGVTQGSSGNQGSNSVFASLTAIGGGAGLTSGTSTGGSGGGAYSTNAVGTGTAGQGNNGGTGTSSGFYGCGGGGGAGAVGANGTTTSGGAGGAGSSTYSSWGLVAGGGQNVGGVVYYAGGGGGSGDFRYSNTGSGIGGFGGGGAGSPSGSTPGVAGIPNTGGGGGGGGYGAPAQFAGAGGSGVIIVRYAKV